MKAEQEQAPTPNDSLQTTEPSPTPLTSKTSEEAKRKNNVTKKKESNEKDANKLNHQVSETSKVSRGQRVLEGKQKIRAKKSGNETARKSMKGVSGGMSHLAVDVAS